MVFLAWAKDEEADGESVFLRWDLDGRSFWWGLWRGEWNVMGWDILRLWFSGRVCWCFLRRRASSRRAGRTGSLRMTTCPLRSRCTVSQISPRAPRSSDSRTKSAGSSRLASGSTVRSQPALSVASLRSAICSQASSLDETPNCYGNSSLPPLSEWSSVEPHSHSIYPFIIILFILYIIASYYIYISPHITSYLLYHIILYHIISYALFIYFLSN